MDIESRGIKTFKTNTFDSNSLTLLVSIDNHSMEVSINFLSHLELSC